LRSPFDERTGQIEATPLPAIASTQALLSPSPRSMMTLTSHMAECNIRLQHWPRPGVGKRQQAIAGAHVTAMHVCTELIACLADQCLAWGHLSGRHDDFIQIGGAATDWRAREAIARVAALALSTTKSNNGNGHLAAECVGPDAGSELYAPRRAWLTRQKAVPGARVTLRGLVEPNLRQAM
jgi:hypothetical protein